MGKKIPARFDRIKKDNYIISFVHEQARNNKSLITIIDEAHLLHLDSMHKLRLLFDKFPKRHNLVLMDQPDLMIRLTLKNNEDIKSRITYSKELKPLNEDELLKFILRESDAVQLPKNSFEVNALELILRSVKGNLRLCANLCYGGLLEACRINERVVDHTHVNSVLIQPHWKTHDDLITREVVA